MTVPGTVLRIVPGTILEWCQALSLSAIVGACNNKTKTMATSAFADKYRPFSSTEFLHLGLEMCCKTDNWKRQEVGSQTDDFISVYNVHPRALAAIWKDLQITPYTKDRVDNSVLPEHVLVVYRWLTSYQGTKTLRTLTGYGEGSLRKWFKETPEKIAALRKIKVGAITRRRPAGSQLCSRIA